ncbi:MAG: AraC family transcriptional regulator [Spirochaetales bacterium]|nr:AraC family transcriptional regulator [Spirochaetales bacterium]
MDYKLTFSGRLHYRYDSGISPHYHPDYQLQLIYSGDGISHLNGEEFSLTKGSIMLIPMGSTHDYHVHSKEGMKTLELKFTTEDEEMIHLLSQLSTMMTDSENKLFEIMSRIVLEGQRKDFYYKQMSHALLLECILTLYRMEKKMLIPVFEGGPRHYEKNPDRLDLMDRVDEFIAMNIHKKISLGELSKYCGYNQEYIYRHIRKKTGMSAIGYVNNRKFERSKQMIIHTDLSLSEIAWNLGFETLQYFSRFFKEHAGISPSAYSQKVRNTIRTDY